MNAKANKAPEAKTDPSANQSTNDKASGNIPPNSHTMNGGIQASEAIPSEMQTDAGQADTDRVAVAASQPGDANSISEGDYLARERIWKIESVRARVLDAILQNPSVERFCYGNPLEARRTSDFENVGAFLAHSADRLARDFVHACDAIDEARALAQRAEADANATTA